MVNADLQRVDPAKWRRYLFYVDLAVFAGFVITLVLTVRHAFVAGQVHGVDDPAAASHAMWLLVVDTAFLVASFMWILLRFFRNEYLVLTRRY